MKRKCNYYNKRLKNIITLLCFVYNVLSVLITMLDRIQYSDQPQCEILLPKKVITFLSLVKLAYFVGMKNSVSGGKENIFRLNGCTHYRISPVIGHLQDLVTCLYIFCLQWGWDASVAALKTLEGHCESMLRGRKFGEQCFCLCNKVFLDGLASQHGVEK